MKFKTCNPYDLRISHIKFEWNRRQKIFSDSKGGPFDDFLKIRKIPKGPPFGKKKFFVSDFTQILCVRPFDHKDFKFWGFFSKKNFSIFCDIFLMLEDPQKILTSKISNFLEKNVRSGFTGSWQIPKGTKS